MRNDVPEILYFTVETLKESHILDGYVLVFLEKKPVWEEVDRTESKSEIFPEGCTTMTMTSNKDIIVKIVVFRDFEPLWVIKNRTDIKRLLPKIYNDEDVFGGENKVIPFQTFGNHGMFIKISENFPDIKSALDLTHFNKGDDEWVWLTTSNPDGEQAMILDHYRHCPQCDRYFAIDHELQKYCDGKCRRAMYVKQRRQRLLEEKKPNNNSEVRCQYCGGIFEPIREHAKYCGIRCRMAAYRQRKKKL
jgi:predicted nucleic acid-binding Zn ribbon protein